MGGGRPVLFMGEFAWNSARVMLLLPSGSSLSMILVTLDRIWEKVLKAWLETSISSISYQNTHHRRISGISLLSSRS